MWGDRKSAIVTPGHFFDVFSCSLRYLYMVARFTLSFFAICTLL